MEIKELLFALSGADAVGCVGGAATLTEELLSGFATVKKIGGLGLLCTLTGDSDHTILLDAHIDQIAMLVTDIDDEGFLTVAKSGGIDIRTLPARAVTVHGKRDIPAVFCSTSPHLSSGEIEYTDIAALKVDTGLGGKARELVSRGDYVTFSALPTELCGDTVTGRSFDDRAAVACLIKTAERLSGKRLPCNVAFLFSDGEELGMRGAGCGAFSIAPNEALAVDVSFGDGIGISPDECGKLGGGAMIGVSPVLDRAVSDRLFALAKERDIPVQTEVMGGKTGTNADVISISRGGVKTGTVSIPLRNMHTEVETLRLSDLNAVCDLLEAYILSGGIKFER